MKDLSKGCYGSVICNDPKSTVCQECTLFDSCNDLADKNREKIEGRDIVDVSFYKRREFQYRVEFSKPTNGAVVNSSTREVLTEYQLSIINNERYPRKARRLVGSLFRKGINGRYLINLMRMNINPFENGKPVILDVACSLLIKGELSKNSLREMLIGRGQSQKTSLSQTHTVLHCLILMSVIDSTFKLRG